MLIYLFICLFFVFNFVLYFITFKNTFFLQIASIVDEYRMQWDCLAQNLAKLYNYKNVEESIKVTEKIPPPEKIKIKEIKLKNEKENITSNNENAKLKKMFAFSSLEAYDENEECSLGFSSGEDSFDENHFGN